MLVLSRMRNERIMIGDEITIMVVEIRGDTVRLGIEAPKETPVHREEVRAAIKKASVQALFGTWPGEDDDGFEASIHELRHPKCGQLSRKGAKDGTEPSKPN